MTWIIARFARKKKTKITNIMEDELEDRVLYQTYLSHMKLLSKFAVGVPWNAHTPFTYSWRLLRLYFLRPEVVVLGLLLFLVFLYMQTLSVWSRGVFTRLHFSLDKRKSLGLLGSTLDGDRLSWEIQERCVAAYAVQGRRAHMEDRFVIHEDVNNTGVSVFAVFDGHGGQFAANYARDNLMKNLNNKLVGVKNLQAEVASNGGFMAKEALHEDTKTAPKEAANGPHVGQEKRASFRKTASTTDECKKNVSVTDAELLRKLDSIRGVTREVTSRGQEKVQRVPLGAYLDKSKATGINYGKIITDEVLATDRLLVEAAKKTMDVAGTTALIALIDGDQLIVANVGDSRGVMCDAKGNAIPLSFDHKPQQIKERNRIKDAGGFITFNGVWRVAGILATSRALGDYPLKDKKLVIPDPDILTFNLTDHRPLFMVLASDGLWDTFSNEEAVSFIKERLNEPHFGAKSITLQAYYRGSLDNITVMVVNLRLMQSACVTYKAT